MGRLSRLRNDRGHAANAALKSYLNELELLNNDPKPWRVPGSGQAGGKFFQLAECRAKFAERFGGTWPWDESVEKWGG